MKSARAPILSPLAGRSSPAIKESAGSAPGRVVPEVPGTAVLEGGTGSFGVENVLESIQTPFPPSVHVNARTITRIRVNERATETG